MSTLIQTHDDFILNLEQIESVEKQKANENGGFFVTIHFISGKMRDAYGDHAKIIWDLVQSSSLQLQ